MKWKPASLYISHRPYRGWDSRILKPAFWCSAPVLSCSLNKRTRLSMHWQPLFFYPFQNPETCSFRLFRSECRIDFHKWQQDKGYCATITTQIFTVNNRAYFMNRSPPQILGFYCPALDIFVCWTAVLFQGSTVVAFSSSVALLLLFHRFQYLHHSGQIYQQRLCRLICIASQLLAKQAVQVVSRYR